MRTREDIEAYLLRTNHPHREIADATWLVGDSSGSRENIVIRIHDGLRHFRMKVIDLSAVEPSRARDFYLALVHGHGVADPRVSAVMDSVREGSTERVVAALQVPESQRAVVRAWWAYTEDRALTWSAVPTGERPVPVSELVAECVAALHALLRISRG